MISVSNAASFGLCGPGDFGILRFAFIVVVPPIRSIFLRRYYSLDQVFFQTIKDKY